MSASSSARRDAPGAPGDAIEKLAGAAERTAETVKELLAADSEGVRFRAALGVLELLTDVEVREMLERVERLEAAANGRRP